MMVALFLASFIATPITYEATACYCPNPEREGVVCNWKEKEWIRKFDIETKQYYYTLKQKSLKDNFIEKKMRKRFLEKGRRIYVKKNKVTGKNVSEIKFVQSKRK